VHIHVLGSNNRCADPNCGAWFMAGKWQNGSVAKKVNQAATRRQRGGCPNRQRPPIQVRRA